MAGKVKPIPYATATSGRKAQMEMERMLENFGCSRHMFFTDLEGGRVVLSFVYRGRPVNFDASYKGWAKMYLRQHPWTRRRHCRKDEWEERALRQGRIATWSIIRDWLKAQITAAESQILAAEHMFLPWTVTEDGRPVKDVLTDMGLLLPPPAED